MVNKNCIRLSLLFGCPEVSWEIWVRYLLRFVKLNNHLSLGCQSQPLKKERNDDDEDDNAAAAAAADDDDDDES